MCCCAWWVVAGCGGVSGGVTNKKAGQDFGGENEAVEEMVTGRGGGDGSV